MPHLNFAQASLVTNEKEGVKVFVLGTVQDGGSPHIGCEKECCAQLFEKGDLSRKIVSLGVVDFKNNKTFLLEATPDIPKQLRGLRLNAPFKENDYPDGIFLTHAHIGHYSGLMYLGKEAANTKNISVYTMPKMHRFLSENGPWGQLVANNNIRLVQAENEKAIPISDQLTVIPFTVPHRDEYSETVGYKIIGPNKTLLFIPDIDKWEKWDKDIREEIKSVDYAFIDATFFDAEEIDYRDISEIPHPFVIESMQLFQGLSISEKNKIHFIHFNHTNPLLNRDSQQTQKVLEEGFQIARKDMVFKL
ncbi:MBL fold metallo-hydrolase [Maribacter sp. 4G9]|uniref:MBL fold metallo-hydrolase n=1 Tax=Maribacter sp. 4G9 TaxID=1889777 RepID=UPI000C14A6E4|nr:MBL fold metallo-hydrolase [Maribacter sp. 4G9]PIB39376.1 pyrroloquinoline quinone biosynthesis protein PqqB [Maribacter sp. 4G9]